MKHIYKYESEILNADLYQLLPKIYAVHCEDRYDLGMLFCCFQEFYENPSNKIRNQSFTLAELMKHYKETTGNKLFTYTEDWEGYNIPANIIAKALDIVDADEYSNVMSEIYDAARDNELDYIKNIDELNFYIIGVTDLESSTCKHELAHGLYYTNTSYKKEINKLIKDMDKSMYNKMRKDLIRIGYADDKKIIDDEIQAYFISEYTPALKMHYKRFNEVFNKYNQ